VSRSGPDIKLGFRGVDGCEEEDEGLVDGGGGVDGCEEEDEGDEGLVAAGVLWFVVAGVMAGANRRRSRVGVGGGGLKSIQWVPHLMIFKSTF
jgi:hypothetical protein